MADLDQQRALEYRVKLTALTGIFAAVFLGSFLFGRYAITLTDLIHILLDRLLSYAGRVLPLPSGGLRQTWSDAAETVAVNVRLPRVIAAAAVGAALSAAGAAYQGMFRNPMVSPDILGASTGAGFGAALGIYLGFHYTGITVLSFSFGLAAVFLAYVISRASKLNTTLALVLAGIVVGSLFSAGTSFIKLIADTENQLPAITYWLMGSLTSIRGRDTLFVFVLVLAGLIPLLLFRWRINLLTVSEDEARSLGINTGRLRFLVIVCATLVTAASVSVSGMIGWIGLVIPHFCRLLFGSDYRRLIPASILMGGSFLILVDDLARTVTASEIPLGILTALTGAPVFMWLILRGDSAGEN